MKFEDNWPMRSQVVGQKPFCDAGDDEEDADDEDTDDGQSNPYVSAMLRRRHKNAHDEPVMMMTIAQFFFKKVERNIIPQHKFNDFVVYKKVS